MSATVTTPFPRDEWLIADGPPQWTVRMRRYLVHTTAPRFVARMVTLDPVTGKPFPKYNPSDAISGTTYSRGGVTLCEIAWIDPQPSDPAATEKLLSAGVSVINAWLTQEYG